MVYQDKNKWFGTNHSVKDFHQKFLISLFIILGLLGVCWNVPAANASPIENITLNDVQVYPEPKDNIWISSRRPFVNWKLSPDFTQQKYRIFVSDAENEDEVYDSKWKESSETNHLIGTNLSEGREYNGLLVLNGYGEPNQAFSGWAIDVSRPVAENITIENIKIENGTGYTSSRNINLDLSASDNASNVIEVQFRVNNKSWSTWESYDSKKSLSLPTGDGLKIVYFRVKNEVGKLSSSNSSTVYLDTIPPKSLDLIIDNGAFFTNSTSVDLSLLAQDALSGVENMCLKVENDNWGDWQPYTSNLSYDLPTGDGKKTVSVKFMDLVGNVSGMENASIFLDTKEPTLEVKSPENSDLDSKEAELRAVIRDNYGLNTSSIKVRVDNKNVSYKWDGENITSDLSLSEGKNRVMISVEDNAKNLKTSNFTLNVSLEPSKSGKEDSEGFLLFWVGMVIVLTIVLVIVILNRSRIEEEISKRWNEYSGGV